MPRRLLALALIGTATAAPLAAVAAGWRWYLDGPPMVLLAVAAGYAAGAWLPRPAAVAAAFVATAGLVVANQLDDVVYHWLDDTVFFLVLVGGPAAAGAAVTTRAEQVRRLERLQVELDEQQRIDVAAARLDEQNRIHHDVHTRLAERIAGIAVRAEGARRSGDEAALGVIEAEARAVLDQLRGALGSIRSSQPEAAPEPPPADRRPRPSLLDVALAMAIGGALAVETAVVSHARGPLWANVVAAVVTAAPLAWRRGWPILSAATTLAAGCAMSAWLTPVPATVTGMAVLAVVFYSIGAWCGRWWWVVGWVVAAAGSVAMEAVSGLGDDGQDGDTAWIVLVFTVGAVALGRITAGWQARVRRTEDVVRELERGRGAAVRLAMARGREEVAADLHDTVAHAMTVVCLHAGGGRRLPVDATAALQTICDAAEASLAELRDGIDAFESVDHPLEASRVAAVGRRLGVDVELTGTEVTGPAAVLGYRVVREAIVNVARHAAGATARVRIERDQDVVTIDVANDASAGPPTRVGTGSGLTGLARALETAGGTLTWGAQAGGGFRVTATIPEATP